MELSLELGYRPVRHYCKPLLCTEHEMNIATSF